MSGYLEFGEVLSRENEWFLAGTEETWDEGKKPLGGERIRILRIQRESLPWLAKEVLSCLTESEFDDLMCALEEDR